jgi:hypothetical protein
MMAYTAEERKANRAKWVAALRSGKYRQARKALTRDGGFCCLGVACDISGLVIWRGDTALAGGDAMHLSLPRAVRDWLGLRTGEGRYGNTCLSGENDNGAAFAEIADIIEAEPEGLIAREAHP